MSTEVPSLESYVQVGPDSTGKKVRNLLVTVPAADGSSTTAYMQVVALADADGFPIPDSVRLFEEMTGLLRDIKAEIGLLRETLE